MKTTVDWLTFRTQTEPLNAFKALKPLFGVYAPLMNLKSLERGAMGFQQAVTVNIQKMPVARIDFGGDSQRGWTRVAMSGKGCEWVKDWDAIGAVESLPSAQIRRLDIALTTWQGEVTHERIVDAHAAGRFGTGGRQPDLQQITSSNPEAGRTCYIGKRTGDKFLRAYEKGFEMAAKLGPLPGKCTHIDGFKVEDIYRTELELKSATTELPWSVIERRDEYFAGSYPLCADLLPGIDADVLQRRPERAPQQDLAAALRHLKTQWGATLYTALHAYGGDMTAVWDKVVGSHHNETLLEAGVLLVEHE